MAVIPIFLPAYCPFLNPIEFMFGAVKKRLAKHFTENTKTDESLYLYEILNKFQTFKMNRLFERCGYLASGTFDISKGLTSYLLDFKDI